jgi:hypothetical protein
MVKRRNSSYAPHDRSKPRKVPMDCTPVLLASAQCRLVKAPKRDAPGTWSPKNPTGGFVL